MKLKIYTQNDIKNKKVILRAVLDVKYKEENGELVPRDDTRLRAIIPTVEDLLQQGAKKVILMSYLGRPGGECKKEYSMDGVAKRLSALMDRQVIKLDDCIGDTVRKQIEEADDGAVLLLENIRFHPGEKSTDGLDEEYARALAANGDVFVNDAFGQSHRPVASIIGVMKYLPSYAGPNLVREVNAITEVINNPKHPCLAIIGGAKISTKLGVISTLVKKCDNVALGGALANTILLAKGVQVGTSLIEQDMVATAKELPLTDTHLHIPVDVVVAEEADEDAPTRICAVGSVKENEKILDIGPDTVKLYEGIISEAKTIIWNGPMGMFEIDSFAKGTDDITRLLAGAKADTVVGGGETVASIKRLNLEGKMTFVSMGGGAMLDLLEKGTLPGIEPLKE